MTSDLKAQPAPRLALLSAGCAGLSLYFLQTNKMNEVMFEKRAAVFYRGLKTRGVANVFRLDKTRAASCLNSFKNIPQRACPSGLKTMVQIVRGEY